MSWEVKFFKTNRGEFPVKVFIKEQDEVSYSKLLHSINLLTGNGPYLKPPYVKKIQNNLYELRVSGKIQIRIFYTFYGNTYYLIHAFKKKSQKTPIKELRIAIDRLKKIR